LESQQLCYSTISIAELALKSHLGKLKFDQSVVYGLESLGMKEFSFGRLAAIEYGSISPDFVRDPFDRMIMSIARANGLLLLTADSQLLEFNAGWIIDATT
jgi:PIN domain nuclease of toxin-antitoxin system